MSEKNKLKCQRCGKEGVEGVDLIRDEMFNDLLCLECFHIITSRRLYP